MSPWCARNRFILSSIGRFLTRDPAEAAIPILTALAFNGDTFDAFLAGFSPTGHYGDGMNLYQFVGSNPVNRSDPLGLEWGMEDETDDAVNDLMGHRLYALGMLNEGAKWASLGLSTALNIAGALLGIDVFQSACLIWSGQGGFWEGLDIIMSLNPVGRLGKVGAVVGKAFRWTRKAARVGDDALDVLRWLRQGSKNVDVYIGYRDGRAVYVGITNDVVRRQGEHGSRFVIKKITNNGPLTRNEARAVEQVIIERNPHFENKINSVSPDSEYYDGALEWGLKWLAEHVGSGQF